MSRPCSRLSIVILSLSACLILLFASASVFFFQYVTKKAVESSLPLRNGSVPYGLWLDIPVPIRNDFYLFHVQNPLEILRLGEKPVLTQKGPYSYRQRRHKFDVSFSADGSTVAYRERALFHFDPGPDGRGRDEDEVVRVINGPLLSVLDRAKDAPFLVRFLLNRMISQTGSSLFVERPVKELLWGYEDPLLKQLQSLAPSLVTQTRFGWFIGQNDTDGGLTEVFTGQDGDLSRYLNVLRWRGSRRLKAWPDARCDAVTGTDGSAFGPFVDKAHVQSSFAPNMCRSFKSTFLAESTVSDVPVFLFQMSPSVFANASLEPDNACFRLPGDSLRRLNGVLNISRCSRGAPMVVSRPHFLWADEEIQRSVHGLSPSPAAHQTFVSVEPTSGAVLRGRGRLQLNIFARNLPAFEGAFQRSFPGDGGLVFPVYWLEQSATLDPATLSYIRGRVTLGLRLSRAVQLFLFLLAGVVAVAAASLALHRRRKRQKFAPAPKCLVKVTDLNNNEEETEKAEG